MNPGLPELHVYFGTHTGIHKGGAPWRQAADCLRGGTGTKNISTQTLIQKQGRHIRAIKSMIKQGIVSPDLFQGNIDATGSNPLHFTSSLLKSHGDGTIAHNFHSICKQQVMLHGAGFGATTAAEKRSHTLSTFPQDWW